MSAEQESHKERLGTRKTRFGSGSAASAEAPDAEFVTIADDEILARLLALNQERALLGTTWAGEPPSGRA